MTALKAGGFTPGANVSIYLTAKRVLSDPPLGAAVATVAADANGDATFDVTDEIRYSAYGPRLPDSGLRWVDLLSSTTKGGST